MSRELVDPSSVGVDPEKVAILLRRARLEVESGRLPSCQVALGIAERVADVIPEFGTNGKEVVTVGQVLTHTAGFPMALFFQALYHSGLWSAEAVAEGSRVHVEMQMSGIFGRVDEQTRMGLFVEVPSNSASPPGPTASPSTFGMGGAPTQQAWCDPEAGLSYSFTTNGFPATGYDRTRAGRNQAVLLSGLAFDCAVK